MIREYPHNTNMNDKPDSTPRDFGDGFSICQDGALEGPQGSQGSKASWVIRSVPSSQQEENLSNAQQSCVPATAPRTHVIKQQNDGDAMKKIYEKSMMRTRCTPTIGWNHVIPGWVIFIDIEQLCLIRGS